MNGSKKLKITGWVLSILIAFIAAILMAAYLGGATATHVRVGEAFFFPVIVGVAAWVALGLRQPDVFRLAFGSNKFNSSENQL